MDKDRFQARDATVAEAKDARGAGEEKGDVTRAGQDREGPPTGEVRIDALQAQVVARLQDSPADLEAELKSELSSPPETEAGNQEDQGAPYELPDWSDPPTGQVPRVLLEDPDAPEHAEPIVRGPSWRERSADWTETFDLSVLGTFEEDAAEIAGTREPEPGSPFSFHFDEVDEAEESQDEDDTPWDQLLTTAPPGVRAARRHPRHRAHTATAQQPTKKVGVAILTGSALALVAICCFLGGSPSTLGLFVALVTVAAAEAFAALQRGGYRPATLLGLLAVPALLLCAYFGDPTTLVITVAATLLAIGCWFVCLPRQEPLADIGASVLVVCWLGILGSFAGLLLAPGASAHGVAFVVAAVLCTVAHDVGSYGFGAWRGTHRLAPRISPGKTIEGLLGGTVATFAMALIVVAHLHPFDLSSAAALAAVVAVFAPFGDLFESLVKRSLSIKDMGSLLPAHGGVLDRVDAMLFVMAPTYFLIRLLHFL